MLDSPEEERESQEYQREVLEALEGASMLIKMSALTHSMIELLEPLETEEDIRDSATYVAGVIIEGWRRLHERTVH